MIRVVFFGTELFGREILAALYQDAAIEISAVVTQPARPVGRAQVLTPSPVFLCATEHNTRIYTPATFLDNHDAVAELAHLDADIFIVAQYGALLPHAVLALPKCGTINVHASLLPAYRGASPVHAALLSGETETGITFMLIDEQLDHGPLLATYPVPIKPDDTTPVLMQRLALCAALHIVHTVTSFVAGEIIPREQIHAEATKTRLLKRSSGFVLWNTMDAAHIERMTRAFVLWPGVSTWWRGTPIKILAAHVMHKIDAPNEAPPGTIRVCDGNICVATCRGVLVVTRLARAGATQQEARDFIHGAHLIAGERFTDPPSDVLF